MHHREDRGDTMARSDSLHGNTVGSGAIERTLTILESLFTAAGRGESPPRPGNRPELGSYVGRLCPVEVIQALYPGKSSKLTNPYGTAWLRTSYLSCRGATFSLPYLPRIQKRSRTMASSEELKLDIILGNNL